jgi:hypothetical protein
MIKHRIALAVALALTISSPEPATGQEHWKWTTATGYGAVGAGLGFISMGDEWYALDSRVLVGGAAGVVVGWALGRNAAAKVENGVRPGTWHKNSIRLGTVLAGATAGGIVSGFIIQPSGSSRLGSDVAIFTTAVSAGGALGVLLQLVTDGEFEPRDSLEPVIGITRDGRPQIGLGISVGGG